MNPEQQIQFTGFANPDAFVRIKSQEQLTNLARELREYARNNEFDYQKARDEALAQQNRVTEEVVVDLNGQEGKMLRSRSLTSLGYAGPWTKLIRIGFRTLQVVYYEFQGQGSTAGLWFSQLQIVDTLKYPVGDIESDLDPAIGLILKEFVDVNNHNNYTIPNGVPPHVLVLIQPIQR
jgi:hypothetical protein